MALFRTPLPRLGSLLVSVPTLWLGRQRKPSRMVRTTRRLVGSLFPFVCSILSVMVQSSCSFHQTARGNYITAAFRTYRRKCHLKTSSSYQAYTWPLQLISSFWISLNNMADDFVGMGGGSGEPPKKDDAKSQPVRRDSSISLDDPFPLSEQ
jgi:hypothetical protein